jgi:hypothetical protein
MSRHLDFLVIGAQKCATSWLYYCLKDHQELHLPAKKREVEYLGGELYKARGADWYFSLFAGAGDHQRIGDVSVEYLFDARSPAVVHRYTSNVKLIMSLRDPIDRAISAYFWYVRRGDIPNSSVEDVLSMAVEGSYNRQDPQVIQYCKDIIARGFYDVQMKRYLQYFSVDQMLVVLYDEIKMCPFEVMRKIYKFIGVNPDIMPASLNKKPKINTYLSPLLYLERIAPKLRLLGKGIDIANQLLHRMGIERERPLITQRLHRKLRETYEHHIETTRNIVRSIPEEQQPFSIELLDTWMKNCRD